MISLVKTFLLIFCTPAALSGIENCLVGGAGSPGRGKEKPGSQETMQAVYEKVKTPHKYGILIKGEGGRKVDCPSVVRQRPAALENIGQNPDVQEPKGLGRKPGRGVHCIA